jgi:hypothetical protein
MNEFQKNIIAMKIEQAKHKPCILCEKKSDGAGVFIPDAEFAAKLGQPKKKIRLAVYSLCSRCQKKNKNWMDQIEDKILSDYLQHDGNRQN